MIDLNRFFNNPFTDRAISNTELQKFAEDHLAKLAAANDEGIWDALLTDGSAAYEAYFGGLTDASLRMALQKAATQTMNSRWAEFVKWMTTRGEARVKDRAEKPSAVYTEFFPLGLSEYHSATVPQGQTLVNRAKASAATHAALLGADFKAKVDELADGYLSAREVQMERKGGRADGRGDRDAAKAALQDRLFVNLLTLAMATKDPAKCAIFFDQSLLENPTAAGEPEPDQA
ncbi:hypothetical protein [Haloferula sargassicola]